MTVGVVAMVALTGMLTGCTSDSPEPDTVGRDHVPGPTPR